MQEADGECVGPPIIANLQREYFDSIDPTLRREIYWSMRLRSMPDELRHRSAAKLRDRNPWTLHLVSKTVHALVTEAEKKGNPFYDQERRYRMCFINNILPTPYAKGAWERYLKGQINAILKDGMCVECDPLDFTIMLEVAPDIDPIRFDVDLDGRMGDLVTCPDHANLKNEHFLQWFFPSFEKICQHLGEITDTISNPPHPPPNDHLQSFCVALDDIQNEPRSIVSGFVTTFTEHATTFKQYENGAIVPNWEMQGDEQEREVECTPWQ